MRTFSIDTRPYEDERKLYKHNKFTLETGVTVLVGCNGAGKSTMLDYIKSELNESNTPYITFDNLKDGGNKKASELSFYGDYSALANWMCSSEGENILMNIGYVAHDIGVFMRTGIMPKQNLFEGIFDDKEPTPTKSKECWILFDALDSGLSIDNIVEVKETLFKLILEDSARLGKETYIVVVANEYEMASGENCFSVQDCKYIDIDSYEDYKNFVLESRAYKDKQIGEMK